jgi:hypothetical protein
MTVQGDLERRILRLLEEKGPLTGAQLWDALGGDQLLLWRACKLSPDLLIRPVGTRYLRLDRRVDGFARLSPSILREFLTYSVIGPARDPSSLLPTAEGIASHIESVSRAKSQLAFSVVSALASRLETEVPVKDHACFLIAGDIVYNMAHDVPRPERSTGKLVKGSDMDLVVIVEDLFPDVLKNRLDEAIYQEKYRILVTPHIREEIDYVVKYMDKVRTQMQCETFNHLVACKILQEGTLLYGSEQIFHEVKVLLRERGITRRLAEMEAEAGRFRDDAERRLLEGDPQKIRESESYLFYPVEESEEFE